MSRTRQLARGLVSLAALVALVGGVPVALWAGVGWPLPTALPSAAEVARSLSESEIPDPLLIKALAVVVWLAWAQLVVCVVVELVAALGHRQAARVPLGGPVQALARWLVGPALLVSSLSTSAPALASVPLPTVVERTTAATIVAADEAGASSAASLGNQEAPPPAPATGRGAPSPAWCAQATRCGTWLRPTCGTPPASPTRTAGGRSSSSTRAWPSPTAAGCASRS